MNPRNAALAYRIWAIAQPLGWNITVPELAERLESTVPRIRGICNQRGWGNRLRTCRMQVGYIPPIVQQPSPASFSDLQGVLYV